MNDEKYFLPAEDALSALSILAEVAEEFRIAEKFNDAQAMPEKKISKRRVSALSQHGSAWTYNDNMVLWNAYERWQNGNDDKDIQEWKQNTSLKDRSFPHYVFQKHFSKSRTLVGVRKHFFKLKQRRSGAVSDRKDVKPLTITISKNIWMNAQDLKDNDESENDARNDGDDSSEQEEQNNKEETVFLKISNNSVKRRREMRLPGSIKNHSREIEFRQIIADAQSTVCN